jgi:hypothetical protein
MNTMKNLCILIATVLLAGCNSPTHFQIKSNSNAQIPKKSRVYLGIVSGSKGTSDHVPATALGNAARNYFQLQAGTDVKTVEQNISLAQAANCQYVIMPRVIWWDDNVPAWSGNPDRLEVQFTIVNLPAETSNTSVLITGPWWTMMNYSPGEFMDTACENFVRYIVGEQTKTTGTTKF